MLELKGISKKYGNTEVVQNLDLIINKGEFFCLLGPSGCGKTTILRMIAGFEKPSSGSIMLNGKDITGLPPYKRNVNTVFQNYALFPNMDVYNNIAYGLTVRKFARDLIEERVQYAVSAVSLQGFENRMPSSLSGGQQQRVALARALVNQPEILLLDEPMSALDKKIGEQTRAELSDLQNKTGITFVFVTHNQIEALTMAKRVAVMNKGIIEQCDSPNVIYESPSTHFVADFIGNMNFFDGRIIKKEEKTVKVLLYDRYEVQYRGDTHFKEGQNILYGLRPEQLKIGLMGPKEFENGLKGIIKKQLYMGDTTRFTICLENERIIYLSSLNYLMVESKPAIFEEGDMVYISWSRSSGVLLDEKKKV